MRLSGVIHLTCCGDYQRFGLPSGVIRLHQHVMPRGYNLIANRHHSGAVGSSISSSSAEGQRGLSRDLCCPPDPLQVLLHGPGPAVLQGAEQQCQQHGVAQCHGTWGGHMGWVKRGPSTRAKRVCKGKWRGWKWETSCDGDGRCKKSGCRRAA